MNFGGRLNYRAPILHIPKRHALMELSRSPCRTSRDRLPTQTRSTQRRPFLANLNEKTGLQCTRWSLQRSWPQILQTLQGKTRSLNWEWKEIRSSYISHKHKSFYAGIYRPSKADQLLHFEVVVLHDVFWGNPHMQSFTLEGSQLEICHLGHCCPLNIQDQLWIQEHTQTARTGNAILSRTNLNSLPGAESYATIAVVFSKNSGLPVFS